MTTAAPYRLPMLDLDALRRQHPATVADAACECAHDTPALYPILTGIPGFGTAEIPNRFIPGRFLFTVKPSATQDTTIVLSGQDGAWSTARDTADHFGDPNLTAYMPKDADFSIVGDGYRAWVAPVAVDGNTVTPADAANEIAGIVGRLALVTGRNGSIPIRLPFFGAVDVVSEVTGDTASIRSPGAVQPFPMIARRIDVRNDYLAIFIPACASQPLISVEIDGYAIANRELKGDDPAYLKAAWMGRFLKAYPTGVIGPLVARALAAVRG